MDLGSLLIFGVTTIFGIIGYFLRQKDEQQGRQIEMLFKKHDDDAAALQDLRVKIAEKHYEREVVDSKIDKIEKAVKDGFSDMGARFDKLADVLTAHIREDRRP